MNTFLRVDINIVAFIVLTIIYVIAKKRLDINDLLNQIYLKMIPVILIQLFLETGSCIINERQGEIWILIAYLVHMSLFITGIIWTYKGYFIIRDLVLPTKNLRGGIKRLVRIPLLINVVAVLFTPIWNGVFYVTKENIYHRGNYFLLAVCMSYFYVILIFILLLKNYSKISRYELWILMVVCLLPIVGGFIQSLFRGVLLAWSSSAFSLVVMYSYLQQRMVQLDYLTGVWSRGSFEFFIEKRLLDQDCEQIGMVYCDIDGLKEINDQYGHIEGDYAIKTATKIIKNSIRKTDIIVRMGGDEFIIVVECDNTEFLKETLFRINQNFINYNKASSKEYELSCSFGYDILHSDYESIEQFIHHVDTLMYQNKKSKKERIK